MWETILKLVLLAIASFIQNMAFTAVSRSRNSGDPAYHRKTAWASNGVWFITQVLIISQVWKPLMEGQWFFVIVAGLVYVVCTTEGSVAMMKHLLKNEKGLQRVGARKE